MTFFSPFSRIIFGNFNLKTQVFHHGSTSYFTFWRTAPSLRSAELKEEPRTRELVAVVFSPTADLAAAVVHYDKQNYTLLAAHLRHDKGR